MVGDNKIRDKNIISVCLSTYAKTKPKQTKARNANKTQRTRLSVRKKDGYHECHNTTKANIRHPAVV